MRVVAPNRQTTQEQHKHGELTFTLNKTGSAGNVGLVKRISTNIAYGLGQKFGLKSDQTTDKDDRKMWLAEHESNDQHSVADDRNICWSVLFRNETGRKHPDSLLGDIGHTERLPAWMHLISGIAFASYAMLRPFVLTVEHTAAQTWTTIAAYCISICFLSSAVFHITSPSEKLAFYTRQLDYTGVYVAMAAGSVADYAIATRSFANVNLLSVIDTPLAALCVCVFFAVRRALTPSHETWTNYMDGYTPNFGLFRRMHVDKAHTGTRHATSFLLAISTFVTTPSLFKTMSDNNGTSILVLELICFFFLIVGLSVDNGFASFPDRQLASGNGPSFLVCKPCGCICNAHSLWHAVVVLATLKSTFSRELALSWQ